MDNVVGIGKRSTAHLKSNETVIMILEDLLEKARAGEVSEVSGTLKLTDGTVGLFNMGYYENFYETIGVIEELKAKIQRNQYETLGMTK